MMNHQQIEPHYLPDMATELDSPSDILADQIAELSRGATPRQVALSICKTLLTSAEQQQWEIAAPILSDAISLMIQPCRNLKGRIWGLVFSFGLADVANGNSTLGIQSMADEGRRNGVSRALMSHYKREWDNLFSRYGRVYGKSPEACEKNRKARLKVLDRQKKNE